MPVRRRRPVGIHSCYIMRPRPRPRPRHRRSSLGGITSFTYTRFYGYGGSADSPTTRRRGRSTRWFSFFFPYQYHSVRTQRDPM